MNGEEKMKKKQSQRKNEPNGGVLYGNFSDGITDGH
jgi:hypothetical protein